MNHLSFYLSSHMSLGGKGRGSASGVAVAVVGIALAIVVMMLSVSVMTGFRDEIRRKITGFESQLTIAPISAGETDVKGLKLSDFKDVEQLLPQGSEMHLSMRQPAIFKTTETFTGIVVKGMDAEADWEFIRSNLTEGTIPDFRADSTFFHMVVSRSIADRLGIGLGDRVDTYFLGSGVYRARRLKVAGIYDTHFSDFDRHMIYSGLPMLRQVASMADSTATLIEINRLPSDEAIDTTATAITRLLQARSYADPKATVYAVANIHQTAALYFNWLSLLDTNVVVILVIMAVLSSLTLVSSLFILILRRVNMIGILKALGASNGLIRHTFILLTLRILILGLLIGNAIALGVILIQRATGFIPLDPEAYYLDHVPMALDPTAILLLNLAVILVAALVLIIPSSVIATIPPSKAINYE